MDVASSSIAFIEAANKTYDLVKRFIDAPSAIHDAEGDLESTIGSVKTLHTYLRDHPGTSLSGEAHLIKVLNAGKDKCDAFRVLLEDCSKHSVDRTDGKLSLVDRGKVVYKDKDIKGFRDDIARYRQAINIAAIPLLLSTSASSTEAIQGLTIQLKSATNDISRQYESLEERIEDLKDSGIGPEAATMIALENRKATLAECQKLIEISRKAAETNDTFRATYGKLVVRADGTVVVGDFTGHNFRNVDMTTGDITVEGRGVAISARGLPDLPASIQAAHNSRPIVYGAQQSPPATSNPTKHEEHNGQASTEDGSGSSSNNSAPAGQLTIMSADDCEVQNLWAMIREVNMNSAQELIASVHQ